MAMHLLIIDGPDEGRYFPLPATGLLSIGNSRKNTDITVHDLVAARVHCELEVDGERVLVADLDTTNGTFINGQKVQKGELRLGEVLRVGNSYFRLDPGNSPAGEAPTEEETVGVAADSAADGEVVEDLEVVDEGGEAGDDAEAVEPLEVVDEGGEEADQLEVVDEPAEETDDLEVVDEAEEAAEPEVVEEEAEAPVELADLPELPPERLEELTGYTLGYYDVGPVLGRGHCGLVFRARDTRHGRDVALKVLSPDFPTGEAEMQPFVETVRALLPLRHPNLVSVQAAGRTGHYCWLALDLVEGESLAASLARRASGPPPDWRRAFKVAVHVGRALEFAHRHHLVHRNVTAQNVLWQTADKTARLGDLGLARALQGSLVRKMAMRGKLPVELPYLAPEQTLTPGRVDHQSDLYSLGVLAYALLTGRVPFGGEVQAEVVRQIRTQVPAPPHEFQPGVPAPLEKAVLRLLAKKPQDRYPSAAELLADLQQVGAKQGVAV